MWKLLKATALSFIEDEALSGGVAMAFYMVTSLAPVLLIVVAIAGLAFGQEAAQDAITAQLGSVINSASAGWLSMSDGTATGCILGGSSQSEDCRTCRRYGEKRADRT